MFREFKQIQIIKDFHQSGYPNPKYKCLIKIISFGIKMNFKKIEKLDNFTENEIKCLLDGTKGKEIRI